MPAINIRSAMVARTIQDCSDQITLCQAAVRAHRDLLEELTSRCLLPGQAADAIKHLSENALDDPTPARLAAHADVLAGMKAIAQNQDVQFQAKRQLDAKCLDAQPALRALALAATASLDRQIFDLETIEREWLRSYGLPYEPTALMRSAVAVKASIVAALRQEEVDIEHLITSDLTPRMNIAGLEVLLHGPDGE